jgi:putative hemolysin
VIDPAGQPRLTRSAATAAYPAAVPALPDRTIDAGRYVVRFARGPDDLDRLLRLRYEVFNLELGEGLDASHLTGRDEDELDARLHHLMILTRAGEVAGTYRMQTAEMAEAHGGFYAEQEFDLSRLPAPVVRRSVEIGRACVARAHRNGRVLHLLWRGLAAYLSWNAKRVLFGCCSVNSQDPAMGLSVHRHLEAAGAVHPVLRFEPRPGHACPPEAGARPWPAPHVPALFQTYLNLGARVCGPPAVDRQFKTIDWFVMLDVAEIDPATYRAFFR